MKTKVLLVLALCVTSGVASAETPYQQGWFAGISGGQVSYDADQIDDDKDISFALSGGYRFRRNFALQAAFADLGHFTGDGALDYVEYKSLAVTALWLWPLGESGIEPFVQIGGGSLWQKQRYTFPISGVRRFSDHGFAIKFGLGVGYTPAALRQFSFYLAYDHHAFLLSDESSNDDSSSVNLGVVNVGVRYYF